MKKIIFFLTFLLLVSSVTAQVTETTEGGDIEQTLNMMFQNVDVTQAPTGIFMNKAIYFTNIHDYDGAIISDTTNVNINTFGWLYTMLGMAKVGTNTFPNADILYGRNSYAAGSPVPLVLLCQRYNHFKDNIFSDNLITTTNNQLFDVVGRTQSPYAEDTLFLVTPIINAFKTNDLSFVLPFDRILQNVGSFQTISIDFGTGSGFQAITVGQAIDVTLPSGMNRPILQVVFSNGRILKCRFEIEVAETVGSGLRVASGGIDDIYRPENSLSETISATRPQDGTKLITAEVTTFYACSDQKVRKPLYILDGFNSDTDTDGITTKGFLDFFNTYQNTPIPPDGDRPITRDLRKDGYDLIFVNWLSEGGRDDIRRTAFLFQQILDTMNTRKALNQSLEKNVIIGISMGGVIAKYALLDLENKNPTLANGGHDVKTFISYDSPLQGANIPLGFQYMLKDLGDGILGGVLGRNVGKLQGGLVSLKSPAAKQLITYQAFDVNPKSPTQFTSFYNELNSMGNLQKCAFRTISNGSMIGTPNFAAGKSLLKLTAVIPPLVSLTGAYLKFEVNTLPPTSQNNEIIYKRTIVFIIRGIPLPILPALSIGIRDFRALDSAPGGTTTVGIEALPVGKPGRYDDGNQEVLRPTFIPVVSALDLRSPERDKPLTNVSDEDALLTNQIVRSKGLVGSRSSSQFDAAVFIENPENRVANQVHAGLSYRTTGYLLYYLISRDPLQTDRTVNLTNRTYNFGTNALPYPVTPPSPGTFKAKDLNNIIDYIVNVENTGKLWVNRSGKIGFTDVSTEATNATGTDYSLIIRQAEGCKALLDNFNGIVNVKNNGTVVVGDASVSNTANIRIRKGGSMNIQNAGNLVIEKAAMYVAIESGGKLTLESGSITNITGESAKIIVKTGGQLIINGGANLNLTGLNASILVESGGELVINGAFNFSGIGYFQFDQGHTLTLNANLVLRGTGKPNMMIKLTDAPLGTVNILKINDKSVDIANALVSYGTNTQIDVTNSTTSIFTNSTFASAGSNSALNFLNSGTITIQTSDFNNLAQGVTVVNTTTPHITTQIRDCNFSLVTNGLSVNLPVNSTLNSPISVTNTTFSYPVGSVALASGLACKFVNIDKAQPITFTGNTLTSYKTGIFYANSTGIELQNASIAMNNSKILNFKTGISAEKQTNNNVYLSNEAEIGNCETGINMVGGNGSSFATIPFGNITMTCSKLINNITGIKGTDARLGIDVRNTFQNATVGAVNLLFDICYPATAANLLNIPVSNNLWVGGFRNMPFRLTIGSGNGIECTDGVRRRLEQCTELTSAPTECKTAFTPCCNQSTTINNGAGTITTGTAPICAVLPIELSAFSGKHIDIRNPSTGFTERGILLTWQSFTEKALHNFEVEKSTNGTSFSTIADIKARNTPSVYTLTDDKFSQSSYYRLKINDLDGASRLSKTVYFEKNSASYVKILRDTEGSVWIDTNDKIEYITVTNSIGQQIKSTKDKRFSISDLASGIYIVSVKTDKGFLTEKFFKR